MTNFMPAKQASKSEKNMLVLYKNFHKRGLAWSRDPLGSVQLQLKFQVNGMKIARFLLLADLKMYNTLFKPKNIDFSNNVR